MTMKIKPIDMIWIILMAITVMNALLAETSSTSASIIILVALSTAFKGQMVVDHFMGLKGANRHFRFWMNAYFVIIPALIVLVYLFPEPIAQMTSLR